ncbi:hypothetical protein [Bacillus atrophaeus]|uniref:hypothetical protein n=1 Tax=Bacillus atrophaeus TaxID=1452 RepID=UPI002E203153|nr:hypothetical protein [Bacillus atrophaeus]
MNYNEQIIRYVGICFFILSLFNLKGIIKPDINYLFAISVCACFLALADYIGDEKLWEKKTKSVLYFLSVFALIVVPQMAFDKVFKDLDKYTNFFTLLPLCYVFLYFPDKLRKNRQMKQKDERIKELEEEIEKMKK